MLFLNYVKLWIKRAFLIYFVLAIIRSILWGFDQILLNLFWDYVLTILGLCCKIKLRASCIKFCALPLLFFLYFYDKAAHHICLLPFHIISFDVTLIMDDLWIFVHQVHIQRSLIHFFLRIMKVVNYPTILLNFRFR